MPILKLQAAEIPSPRESASMERDSESFYAKDSDSENRGLLKSALLKQRKSEIKSINISYYRYSKAKFSDQEEGKENMVFKISK